MKIHGDKLSAPVIRVYWHFIEFIKEQIWIPFAPKLEVKTGRMLKMIQQFVQTLDDYTGYLGCNMRPIVEKPDIFVPLYRDENVKWAVEHKKKYRSLSSETWFYLPRNLLLFCNGCTRSMTCNISMVKHFYDCYYTSDIAIA